MQKHRSIGKQISTLAKSLSAIVDKKLASLGLNAATLPVIDFLYENDGVHQDVLAEALQFDKSSATRSVERLLEEGYVTKTVDPSNRRRNIIQCTEKALAAKKDLIRTLKSVTDELFLHFSEEEIEQYFSLTRKIDTRAKSILKELK